MNTLIVIPENSRNWILGGIAREIQRVTINTDIVEIREDFHLNYDAIILMHVSLLFESKLQNSLYKTIVFFTHFRRDIFTRWFSYRTLIAKCKGIVVMNTYDKRRLGFIFLLRQASIAVGIMGVDNSMFYPIVSMPEANKIGFVSNFYKRKNPEMILNIVRNNPDLSFVLLGRNWESFDKWQELISLQNFQYMSRPYSEYPEFYAMIKILVSVSKKEGGPAPLLEGLASGCFVVSSNVGFAKDIIVDGLNGIVLPLRADVNIYSQVLNSVVKKELDRQEISASVRSFTWKSFAKVFYDFY